MNLKTKLTFVAFALSLTTTASFGQVALSQLATDFGLVTTDLAAISLAINAAAPSAFVSYTNAATAGDLAVIDQTATTSGNDAYISQVVGTGTVTVYNVASILQTGDSNKAYIDQAGDGNSALISQSTDGNLGYIAQLLAIKSMAGIEQSSAIASAGYITQSGSLNSALIIQK